MPSIFVKSIIIISNDTEITACHDTPAIGRSAVRRDKKGFGVMIFPDNIFKYASNMVKHIPILGAGTVV